ncbi:NADHX epimerase [Aspergillus aculeatinus CBS 121060]|uniref:YjeF N-terminal domain-like protein n=1 Tax=Aspergillus aculeatinus CBS 121060 TaxID=1448322 RepID=A0ACD1HN70_9EURO|nr:YjeF N-terminal domain-like protein [Aspergillus aculeatinus CBS 121060]RAH75309.1 YjeF N-terminal domain-like protein [Aspergillus aculeatinus CBS 121060]
MLLSSILRRKPPLAASFRKFSTSAKMSLKALSSKDAASLDKDLMETGGFSLDQLMELAGLSVSQAVYRIHPPSAGKNILVICGPGNNGEHSIPTTYHLPPTTYHLHLQRHRHSPSPSPSPSYPPMTQSHYNTITDLTTSPKPGGDGLVAARHLAHFGYNPKIYYPKEGKNELYQRLKTQLRNLSIPILNDTHDLPEAIKTSHLLVDAIFGFSFGGPLRDPFPEIISQMEAATIPVLSVDAPSSWDIESGPPRDGPGAKFMPEALISLTAPKPCVKFYRGRHFVGGRFLTRGIAEKYGLDVPDYQGVDQVLEVGVDAEGRL